MQRLSDRQSDLKESYGIVVIGSGYGAAITAARLSEAKYDLCILERGKEWATGDFPDSSNELLDNLHSKSNLLGLYNYHAGEDIDVFTGNGLGGTSLINANVLLKPSPAVFEQDIWPDEINMNTLNPYYDKALKVLTGGKINNTYPESSDWPELQKMKSHQKSSVSRPGEFSKLNLAVNFKYDDQENEYGVQQKLCTLCGDCVTGCNVGAKNTLDKNYLPLAKRNGAKIFTGIEVEYISPCPSGGYYVHCLCHREGSKESTSKVIHASLVILGAGSLGSTQILLRSKERGLPISDKLGQRFTSNADHVGVAYNTDHQMNTLGFGNHKDKRAKINVGPLITSAIEYHSDHDIKKSFVIEEGAFPRAFSALRFILPALTKTPLAQDMDSGFLDEVKELKREGRDILGYDIKGAFNHSMIYLGMGHDSSDGLITLDHEGNIRIHWDKAPSEEIFNEISNEMRSITQELGGTYIKNPRWSKFLGNNLITVHPLGGCPMGKSVNEGVVDSKGRVFNSLHKDTFLSGLYVADGAVIPGSLGVNLLLTISALAEKIAQDIIDDKTVNKKANPNANSDIRSLNPEIGFEFTETMKGYLTEQLTDAQALYDFIQKNDLIKQGDKLSFKLTMYIDSIKTFINKQDHEARAIGSITWNSSTYSVKEGRFNLFILDSKDQKRKMLYSLPFEKDGDSYLLEGFKVISDDPGIDVLEIWKDTTSLFVTIYKGKTNGDSVIGQGILYIKLKDFLKLAATFRVRHAQNPGESYYGMELFAKFFFGELWDTYFKK